MRYILIFMYFAVAVHAKLFVYESFDYDHGVLGNTNGGIGFAGTWGKNISGTSLTGFSEMPLDSLCVPGSPDALFNYGGCINVGEGNSFSAVRLIDGLFGVDIDLSVDEEYYISFLYRRQDSVNTNSDEWFAVKFYSFTDGVKQDFLTIGTNSNESIYIDGIGGLSQTTANCFELNKTYLFVVKIIANNRLEPAQSDQVFLKIYEEGDYIDNLETEIEWLLVSGHDEYNSSKADCFQILGGSGTGYYFDELRIGTDWHDVVDVKQTTEPLSAVEVFDYKVSSNENFDKGIGFNGPWSGSDSIENQIEMTGFMFNGLLNLESSAIKYKPSGGCINKQSGVIGQAHRYFKPQSCIDLNKNDIYYLSCLIRRDDQYNANGDEWSVFRFYSVEGQGKSEAFSVVFNSNESVSINGIGSANTESGIMNLNETYLVILKIVAQNDAFETNYDQIFVKIVDSDTVLSRLENSEWTLVGGIGENSHELVNLLQIASDTDTGFIVDEIRCGNSWESVTTAEIEGTGSFLLNADISEDYEINEVDLACLIEHWLL